jgi:predicted DNA-binding protein
MTNNKDNSKITTLKLQKETKERLDKLKEYTKETYEELLRKLLHILNTVKVDPEKAQGILKNIDELRKKRFPQKKENKKPKSNQN